MLLTWQTHGLGEDALREPPDEAAPPECIQEEDGWFVTEDQYQACVMYYGR